MKVLSILDKFIQIVEDTICLLGLWFSTFLIFLHILNRYIFHFEIMVMGDLALYIFVFFALLSIAVTTREEMHSMLDIIPGIVHRKNHRIQCLYKIIINIISLILVGILLPLSYKFMLNAIEYPQYGTIITWFNTSWLRITLFIMWVLAMYHLSYRLIKTLKLIK